jgi:hypothetical protein
VRVSENEIRDEWEEEVERKMNEVKNKKKKR